MTCIFHGYEFFLYHSPTHSREDLSPTFYISVVVPGGKSDAGLMPYKCISFNIYSAVLEAHQLLLM